MLHSAGPRARCSRSRSPTHRSTRIRPRLRPIGPAFAGYARAAPTALSYRAHGGPCPRRCTASRDRLCTCYIAVTLPLHCRYISLEGQAGEVSITRGERLLVSSEEAPEGWQHEGWSLAARVSDPTVVGYVPLAAMGATEATAEAMVAAATAGAAAAGAAAAGAAPPPRLDVLAGSPRLVASFRAAAVATAAAKRKDEIQADIDACGPHKVTALMLATTCDGGCHRMERRLSPYVMEAVTVYKGGCNRM